MYRHAKLQVAAAEERAAQRGEDLAFLVLDISATNFIDADTVQMLKASCGRCCAAAGWLAGVASVLHASVPCTHASAASVTVASCSTQAERHLPTCCCCCCHRI